MQQTVLVTGGAGFIGSNLVRLLVQKYPATHFVNLDKLTYAGNLANLQAIENRPNYTFIKGDITSEELIVSLFERFRFDKIIHLAAESHVDRSILNPMEFVMTNIIGTVTLLNAARTFWKGREDVLFYHVSTDEVFGSLHSGEYFVETTSYDPQSPYSASKASSDHFVRAYGNTYNLPYIISNCSNNYGPYQFPEKLIPLFIANILHNKSLPVYGKGDNVRDWLWVIDHCEAIDLILHQGTKGETYVIGGRNEWKNIDLVHTLCRLMDEKLQRDPGSSAQLITYVTDRAGHDHRYAIDPSKLERELGWKPSITFEEGLNLTIDWYLNNQDWMENVRSGTYQVYYETQYGERMKKSLA